MMMRTRTNRSFCSTIDRECNNIVINYAFTPIQQNMTNKISLNFHVTSYDMILIYHIVFPFINALEEKWSVFVLVHKQIM